VLAAAGVKNSNGIASTAPGRCVDSSSGAYSTDDSSSSAYSTGDSSSGSSGTGASSTAGRCVDSDSSVYRVPATAAAQVVGAAHHPLWEDVLTAATAPTVLTTAAAGAVGAVPCPLHVVDIVVVAMAKTPLFERLPAAAKSAFFIPFPLGMAMRINVELLMLAQKRKNEGMVM